MPVRAYTVVVKSQAYLCSCDDCKDWVISFKLKRNADTAMLGHRIIRHGYVRRFYGPTT